MLGLRFVRRLAPTALLALLVPCCGGPDPDRQIADPGIRAPGYEARFDVPDATADSVRFVAVGDGFEASNGPNVVFWNAANVATGRYRLSATVHQLDSHEHHHGAGLVFGATDLDGAQPSYGYFLVHGGGRYLIKRRAGEETAEVTPWMLHPAVVRDDAEGRALNSLAIEVDADEIRFLVNGVIVHRSEPAALPTEGVFGFRMVHNLDIRFSEPVLEALEAGRER